MHETCPHADDRAALPNPSRWCTPIGAQNSNSKNTIALGHSTSTSQHKHLTAHSTQHAAPATWQRVTRWQGKKVVVGSERVTSRSPTPTCGSRDKAGNQSPTPALIFIIFPDFTISRNQGLDDIYQTPGRDGLGLLGYAWFCSAVHGGRQRGYILLLPLYQAVDAYDAYQAVKTVVGAGRTAYDLASRAQEGGAGAVGSYLAQRGARQIYNNSGEDDDDADSRNHN